MLPASAKDITRFAPEGECDGKPVYLIGSLSLKQRARYRAALQREGVTYPNDEQLRESLRRGIRALVEEGQRDALIGLLDEAEICAARGAEAPEELADKLLQLERQMMPVWAEYRELCAARVYFAEMFPIIACQHALRDAENVGFAIEKRDGLVTEETLEKLNPEHVRLIGLKAFSLMHLSREQEKNSASLSSSPPSPTNAAEE